jgi:hypothetical protein
MGIMAIVYQIVQWHMILLANNLARELLTTLLGLVISQGYVLLEQDEAPPLLDSGMSLETIRSDEETLRKHS